MPNKEFVSRHFYWTAFILLFIDKLALKLIVLQSKVHCMFISNLVIGDNLALLAPVILVA